MQLHGLDVRSYAGSLNLSSVLEVSMNHHADGNLDLNSSMEVNMFNCHAGGLGSILKYFTVQRLPQYSYIAHFVHIQTCGHRQISSADHT